MAMVVQHNLTAMNSNRMLGVTNGAQAKSTEKLSSGYKINRAADDAAGLTISEKMRKQIRGLSRASTNAQDGVSAVQTAEGALTEVHSMLQRMNELAVQASNGTNSESDRQALQDEIDQLVTEIDRVAETSKFNEMYLLKGDGEAQKKTVNLKAHDAGLKGKLTDNEDGTATFVMNELKTGDSVSIGGKTYKIVDSAEQQKEANKAKVAQQGKEYTFTEGTPAQASISTTDWVANDTLTIAGKTVTQATAADIAAIVKAFNDDTKFAAKYTASASGDNLVIKANNNTMTKVEIMKDIGVLKVNGSTNVDPTYTANTADVYTITPGTTLYKQDSKEALTEADAIEALKNKETLYTASVAEKIQKPAEPKSKGDGTAATATITLTGGSAWAASGTLTIAGVTVAQSAADSVDKVVAAFNNDTKFNSKYEASKNAAGNLLITARENYTTQADMMADMGTLKYGAAATAVATVAYTANKADTYTGTYYAENGTEPLTAEELAKAVKAGEIVYSNALTAENEITADVAYKLAAAELKKANSVGDTLGTADAANTPAPKTAADYKVGDKVTIGSNEYTIGDTAGNVKSAIAEAILNAAKDVEKTANTNQYTKLNVVGVLSNGTATSDIYVYKDNGGNLVFNQGANLAYATGNVPTATNLKQMVDVNDFAAEGAKLTFTSADGKKLDIAVAKDSDTSVGVISAKKAAAMAETAGVVPKDTANVFQIKTGSTETEAALNFNLHVGADADMTNKINVNINTMNSAFLGIKGLDVVGKGADGKNTADGGRAATYAIDAIADAVAKVSAQRSALGAVQNRLEHTIANLDNIVENTTSAESRIRDTDMAKEMVEYSKNNILAQAGTSMLAQANQSNQSILSLLQ